MAGTEYFTEKDPEKTLAKNMRAVGKSGTLVTGDIVQDDYIQSLNGTQAQEEWHKILLSDSGIRKAVHAIINPIRSATWDIEPASDEDQDLEVANLMKQILFCDIPDGWTAKLDEILTFPWKGHAVFEVVHKNRFHPAFGDYTGLANLAFRDQRTLERWEYTPEGILNRIHQRQSGDIEVDAWMPADTLLIFYNEKKGNDTGYAFCRMLYGNYKRKLLYKQLQAIGIERSAIPVPHLEVPREVDFESDEYQSAEAQLASFTQAESAYFITPAGYTLHYHATSTYDPEKVQKAIKAENEEIAGAIVAMFLEMGIGGNAAVGSSTSESIEFFRDGIEYLANKISETINNRLIPNLVALNFPNPPEVLPKLVHSGIADEAGEELMRVITGYVEKGVIVPDEPLEDHIRKTHNLPAKAEGTMLENETTQDDPTPPNEPEIEEDEIELSTKGAPKTAKQLMNRQAPIITEDIRESLNFSSGKYINDVMARYRQLPESRKQNATSKTKMGGGNNLKKALRRDLTDTVAKSIAMARTEVPSASDVELNNHEADMLRMVEKYGDVSDIKLNEFSKLPSHIQVLIAKQSDLISTDSLNDLKKRIDFSFSSIETKSSDENVIRQAMEDEAQKFTDSNQVATKGNNVVALMVNEGRNTFFFEDDVLDEIHSFTFVNIAPVAAICRELAGTTFATNDAESLRYSPPLHHNCKSYLRANLKSSRGTDRLEISSLSPSADAKKSITL